MGWQFGNRLPQALLIELKDAVPLQFDSCVPQNKNANADTNEK
jgi:hypothetical protein